MKEALSPIVFYKKPIPPTIIFYGTKDRFLDQGRAFLARSKEVGGRVELYTAEGMPHGFFNRPPWTESTLRATDAFLASIGCLKGEPTIAVPAGKADLSKVE
jgi:acetyl esterase/lipase